MSKQEKRYFKIFASNNRKNSNYVKLFDFIAKLEEYKDEIVKEKFSKENFISQLHVTKNLLHKLILRSLTVYHAEISEESKIKELLRFVEILYHKGLYDQCVYFLEKAEKIAQDNLYYIGVIEILEWKSKIAFITTKTSDLKKYLISDYKDEIEKLKILKNKSIYRQLFYEILILNNEGTPIRSDSELEKYEKIMNNSYIKNEKIADSFFSRMMLYHINAYYYLNKGNIVKSHNYCKQVVELLEANPTQIIKSPIHYIAALNNYIYTCTQIGLFEQCYPALNKLKNVISFYNLPNDLTINLKETIFVRSNYLELELYKESCEFEKAKTLINELKNQQDLLLSLPTTRYKIFLLYTISYTYFILEEYSNALWWINNVLNITEQREPIDIFCFARVLNLLIHYELNNYDQIEYINNSNLRFFTTRNRMFKFELLFFSFLKNVISKDELLENDLKKLKTDLRTTIKDNQELKALQYFDYFSWIDCKIKKIGMSESLKNKRKSKLYNKNVNPC
jgi:hypothetical protein